MHSIRLGFALAAALVCQACGGSSGDTEPTPAAAWGDSLTYYGYPQALTAATGREVLNAGVDSQASFEIAARQGGAPGKLTLPGNTLPASGSVRLSSITASPVTASGPQSFTGSILGVAGTLRRITPSGGDTPYLSFERAAAGEAMAVASGTPFIPDTDALRDRVTIFWIGRNNYLDPNRVRADIAACVAHLRTDQYLVLPIVNGNYNGEYLGQANYNAMMSLNESLATTYGAHYLDVREAWVNAYNPALAQDVTDKAHDVPPTSLRRDGIHPNDAGAAVIAAAIQNKLDQMGW